MEVLIELLSALFRALFGEQEPQAKVGPQGESKSRPPQRGPYNYGDGRPSPAGPPKTLADLLEEARRRSAQPGGGAPQPATPKAVPKPAAPVIRPAGSQPPATPAAASPTRAAEPTGAFSVIPAISAISAIPAISAISAAKGEGRKGRRKKVRAEEDRAPDGMGALPGSSSDRQAVLARLLARHLASLRQARGGEKALLGAQALVAGEIFGPPRCKRPQRR